MNLICQHPKLAIQDHLDRIRVVPYGGIDIPVDNNVNTLLNIGGDTSWTKPLDKMIGANVAPIANLIDQGKMPRHFVHCSTAYACPLEYVSADTIVEEESFPEGKSFFSHYGESKYLAERKIESDVGRSDTCYSIVRPSTIGASAGFDSLPRGWATDLKGLSGFYYLCHPQLNPLHTAPVVGGYDSNIISVDHVANTIISALLENVVRNSPTIDYINAAPGLGRSLSWDVVAKSFNPDMVVHDNELSGIQFSENKRRNDGGRILSLIGGKPYRFCATKRDSLLKTLLTMEEQKHFPMTWDDGEDVKAYIKYCADTVAVNVLQKKATKKKTR